MDIKIIDKRNNLSSNEEVKGRLDRKRILTEKGDEVWFTGYYCFPHDAQERAYVEEQLIKLGLDSFEMDYMIHTEKNNAADKLAPLQTVHSLLIRKGRGFNTFYWIKLSDKVYKRIFWKGDTTHGKGSAVKFED